MGQASATFRSMLKVTNFVGGEAERRARERGVVRQRLGVPHALELLSLRAR